MSGIFISYASSDRAQAQELQRRLDAEGFHSVFLDMDAERGISAGDHWERRLYAKLQSCRAIIALNSAAYAESKWCFAEVAQAKAMGKPVFPARIDESSIHRLIQDRQAVDLIGKRADVEDAYRRLFRGLEDAGIVKGSWDGSRPPYPGLAAFEAEDAPVFFGRESAIEEALARLETLRRHQSATWLVLMGASGSGKSSLLRAGILPRLSKNTSLCMVVGPIVPGAEPLQQLARALAETFRKNGVERDWRRIRDLLFAGDPAALSDLVGDLRMTARADAVVLVAVDQLEELLSFDGESLHAEGLLFAKRLRSLSQLLNHAFIVVATLRADFLGPFQDHTIFRGMRSQKLVVDPIAVSELRAVIEGPAQLAGVGFETGLVDQIVRDTETEDALPLLAFALRELFKLHARDSLLPLQAYRELGGLESSVARAPERVMFDRNVAAADPAETARSERETLALRRALLALVRLGDRDLPVRRPARWDALPTEAHRLLERFVQARLLIASGQGKERELRVAHEALFRSWPLFKGWIADARDLLGWRRKTAPVVEAWERSQRDARSLLRGAALSEALGFRDREEALFTSSESAFVEAGRVQEHEERERERRSARRTLLATIGVALVLCAIASLAWQQKGKADENARRANVSTALVLADKGAELSMGRPGRAAVYLSEAYRLVPTDVATRSWLPAAMQRVEAFRASLIGHKGRVAAVSFSVDGQCILTGSADATAKLWDANTGKLLTTLEGHSGAVTAASFSPDGRRVLTAGRDSATLTLWDASTGKLLITVQGDMGRVAAASFSPDGQRLLSRSEDTTAKLWDSRTGKRLAILERPQDAKRDATIPGFASMPFGGAEGPAMSVVVVASFSPDGERIVTAHGDKTLQMWDGNTGKRLVAIKGHSRRVLTASFSPDGQRIVTGSEDMTAKVWNDNTGELLATLEGHSGPVSVASFSPDGQRIVTGSGDNTAKLWDGKSGALLATLQAYAGPASFSPDGQRIITGASDNTAKLWDGKSGALLTTLEGHADYVLAASFSSDGRRIVTGSSDLTAKLWDAQAGKLLFSLVGGGPKASFSTDGDRIVAASGTTAKVWNGNSGKLLASLEGHSAVVTAASFSADGQRIVTASWDHTAKVWDGRAGKLLASLKGHSDRVWTASFSADGQRILTGSDDKTARLWNAYTGEPLATLKGHSDRVSVASFSPDGQRIVTASGWDKAAKLWDGRNGKQVAILEGHSAPVMAASFSPDSQRVLTGSDDNTAKLWNCNTGALIATLEGHSDHVWAVSFAPDGERVVTASCDRTAKLWDGKTGKFLATLEGHSEIVSAAYFSPDGQRIVTASWDRTAKLWDGKTGKFLDTIQGRADLVSTAVFSPDNQRIVMGPSVWDVHLENRSPQAISDLVAKLVPWRLENGALVPRALPAAQRE